MITAFAWILLLAAPQRVNLVDQVYRIPAKEWWHLGEDLDLTNRHGQVTVRFETGSDSKQIRLALLRRSDFERLRNDLAHGVMAMTETGESGELNFQVPGDYELVVDNQARVPANVHLRVWLTSGVRRGPGVVTLSPARQFTVIAISSAFFFGIVTFSFRRLLRATRR
jgi:hypothetical protein